MRLVIERIHVLFVWAHGELGILQEIFEHESQYQHAAQKKNQGRASPKVRPKTLIIIKRHCYGHAESVAVLKPAQSTCHPQF